MDGELNNLSGLVKKGKRSMKMVGQYLCCNTGPQTL